MDHLIGSYTIVKISIVQIFMQINSFINLFPSSTFLQVLTEKQVKGKDSKEKLGKMITFPLVSLEIIEAEIYRTALCNVYYTLFVRVSCIPSMGAHSTAQTV